MSAKGRLAEVPWTSRQLPPLIRSRHFDLETLLIYHQPKKRPVLVWGIRRSCSESATMLSMNTTSDVPACCKIRDHTVMARHNWRQRNNALAGSAGCRPANQY